MSESGSKKLGGVEDDVGGRGHLVWKTRGAQFFVGERGQKLVAERVQRAILARALNAGKPRRIRLGAWIKARDDVSGEIGGRAVERVPGRLTGRPGVRGVPRRQNVAAGRNHAGNRRVAVGVGDGVADGEKAANDEIGQADLANAAAAPALVPFHFRKKPSSPPAPRRLAMVKLKQLPKQHLPSRPQAAATATQEVKERKKPRFKPGTVALRQIRKYQKTVDLLVPRSAMIRLIREVAQDVKSDLRFEKAALDALQRSAEDYLTGVLDSSQHLAVHGKRITVDAKDVRMCMHQRRNSDKLAESTLAYLESKTGVPHGA